MFDNKAFEEWLDTNAHKAMTKVTHGEVLTSEDVIMLTLKAQTNHIAHLEQDLTSQIAATDKDLKEQIAATDKDLKEQIAATDTTLKKEMHSLRQDMDKRFEQVDKRFEHLTTRIDTFIRWSFASLITCSGVIITVIKYLP